jgi:hypothetical protein
MRKGSHAGTEPIPFIAHGVTLALQAYCADFNGRPVNSTNAETARNVSFAVSMPTDEPLLIKPVGMFGNSGEVNRFIGSWLFRHPFTAPLASFSVHRSSMTSMKYDAASSRPLIAI